MARATAVDGDERVAELSRMLAGVGDSAHARGTRPSCSSGRAPPAATRATAEEPLQAPAAPQRASARPTPRVDRGPARVDRRTKDLIKRLEPGEIAVIDHRDLDRVAADGLDRGGGRRGDQRRAVDHRPLSERRADPGRRGRHPAASTTSAPTCSTRARGRRRSAIVDGEVWRNGDELVGTGTRARRRPSIESGDGGRARGDRRRARAVRGEHARVHPARRRRSRSSRSTLPPLHDEVQGRHALVVVRGHDYRDDLAALRPYIREYQPVLIGVDGGADALLEIGFKPDIIIGDFDSVSADARSRLRRRARAPRAPRRPRARDARTSLEWGVEYHEFVAEGTSEDVAMLLAYEAGAQLIVAVGTHATMVEFLDKGRGGHGVDVPHPPAARPGARRRQGREPALRGPGAAPRHRRCSSSPRSWR